MTRPRKLPDGMTTRPGREGFYADFQVNGRRVRRFLGTDFKASSQILTELKARAQKADFGLLDNNYPIADLKRQYLAHCRQTLEASTVGCYEDWLDRILSVVVVPKVSQLSVATILDYRERRLRLGRAGRTINGEVGALNTMLNWGVESAKVIGSNPIAGIEPLPHKPKEGRPLTDAEVPKLLDASPPHWRDIWYAFLVTGLRKSELAGLQFTPEFIDWESREVIVPAWLAKNGVTRRIPMDDRLHEIMRRLEAGRAARQPGKGRGRVRAAQVEARLSRDHVFVTTGNTPLNHKGNLYRAFMRCLERAGIEARTYDSAGRLIEHVDLHSLRRTFATSLIVAGADPKTVQELLGHKTLAMTMKIYTKVRAGTKRQALGRLPYGQGVTSPEGRLQFPAERRQDVTNSESDPQVNVG